MTSLCRPPSADLPLPTPPLMIFLYAVPCSIDFPYAALIYSNEPAARCVPLAPIDLFCMDFPYADPLQYRFPLCRLHYSNEPAARCVPLAPIDLYSMDLAYADSCSVPSALSVSCLPSSVLRLLFFVSCFPAFA